MDISQMNPSNRAVVCATCSHRQGENDGHLLLNAWHSARACLQLHFVCACMVEPREMPKRSQSEEAHAGVGQPLPAVLIQSVTTCCMSTVQGFPQHNSQGIFLFHRRSELCLVEGSFSARMWCWWSEPNTRVSELTDASYKSCE